MACGARNAVRVWLMVVLAVATLFSGVLAKGKVVKHYVPDPTCGCESDSDCPRDSFCCGVLPGPVDLGGNSGLEITPFTDPLTDILVMNCKAALSPDGYSVTNGLCAPKRAAGAFCSRNEACLSGVCGAVTPFLSKDGGLLGGLGIGLNGAKLPVCVAGPNQDCTSGEQCVAGECSVLGVLGIGIPRPTGAQAQRSGASSSSSPGYALCSCKKSKCVPGPQFPCNYQSDCGTKKSELECAPYTGRGYNFVGKFSSYTNICLVPTGSSGCSVSADCKDWSSYDNKVACVNGKCLADIDGPCTKDDQCGAGDCSIYNTCPNRGGKMTGKGYVQGPCCCDTSSNSRRSSPSSGVCQLRDRSQKSIP